MAPHTLGGGHVRQKNAHLRTAWSYEVATFEQNTHAQTSSSTNLRRDRMRAGAHDASATLARTPRAERTTPKAMQQFHLQVK